MLWSGLNPALIGLEPCFDQGFLAVFHSESSCGVCWHLLVCFVAICDPTPFLHLLDQPPTYPTRPQPHAPQLKEMEGTLELVQGQRNELRQEVKDAKAALAEAERRMAVSGPGAHQCHAFLRGG
jgi:hypothetical protein